jgi:hypothetical protein
LQLGGPGRALNSLDQLLCLFIDCLHKCELLSSFTLLNPWTAEQALDRRRIQRARFLGQGSAPPLTSTRKISSLQFGICSRSVTFLAPGFRDPGLLYLLAFLSDR